MAVLSWFNKMKKSPGFNAVALYLVGVFSLAVVAYGCKMLLNFL